MTSIFGTFASAAANSAWSNSPFAMTHLLPHAGKTLRVELGSPLPGLPKLPWSSFAMRVTADGNWETLTVGRDDPVDATLRLTPRVGFELAQLPDKPGAALDLSGDADFVSALRDLQDVLPTAIEDRVSAVVGPIAAHAMMTTLRSVARWPKQAAERVGLGTSMWMTEEQHVLVGRATFDRFARDVDALAKRFAVLEARLDTNRA